ncbi:MAG TPA: hypothetical protein VM263_07445 [Acidimicrobiales bacterium]|nr:hypothetical protein [Acidimicrobiales bacterium]
MSSSAAELSSLATALDELTRRVTAIADGYAGGRREDLAAELYHVERALVGASRSLAKVVDSTRPPSGSPAGRTSSSTSEGHHR